MSDFGRAVADEYRKIRDSVVNRPAKSSATDSTVGAVDPQVKEQMVGDLKPVLDRLIEKHGG